MALKGVGWLGLDDVGGVTCAGVGKCGFKNVGDFGGPPPTFFLGAKDQPKSTPKTESVGR